MKKLINTLKNNMDLTILIGVIIVILAIGSSIVINDLNTNKAYTEALNDLNNIETSIEFDSTNYFYCGSYDSFVEATKNIEPTKTINNTNYYVVYDVATEQKLIIVCDNTNQNIEYLGINQSINASTVEKTNLINFMQNI